MEATELVARHVSSARVYLADARNAGQSLDGQMTCAWNAALQAAMAKLTAAERRPAQDDWEAAATACFLSGVGDQGLPLARWAETRYYEPLRATAEDVGRAVAVVSSFVEQCASA